jgi:hypothetical protein
MGLYEHLLPVIGDTEIKLLSTVANMDDISSSSNGLFDNVKNVEFPTTDRYR